MRPTFLLGAVAAGLLIPAAANAQFTNGGFESGDFTGWTITPTSNGTTTVQQVVSFDIDGPGPLGSSLSAQFSVGRTSGTTTGNHGIELTQMLSLVGGVQYTFGFNWAATRTTSSTNSQGGIFDLIVDGTSLANAAAGSTSSTAPHYGSLSANFTPGSTGSYSVGARITRPFTVPSPATLFQNVDNFSMLAVPEPATLAVLGLGAAAMLRRRKK